MTTPLPDSAAGSDAALTWKTYSVRRTEKEPLLRFITDGLTKRGCRILNNPTASRAPFYIVFETPSGERQGVLAYAFHANSRLTRHRPKDERRFQIKYGSELRGVLHVTIDPTQLVTTIFLGIDVERGIFVAADPVMNNPSPMSRSVEFKDENVATILRDGWSSWERPRHRPRTTTRPTPEIDEDTRVQVLVGGTQDRLFDLVQLERISRGLDPGERHLIADKLASRESTLGTHHLLEELQLPPDALFDLIDGAMRLKMAVRGWVAEVKLEEALSKVPGVTDCHRINAEGQPDLSLRWKGGAPILIECKNVLRRPAADRTPRVDFQRTRASKSDPCSRYYRRDDFSVLAACLHPITEEWNFEFATTAELPSHRTCKGRISNNLRVAEPHFTASAEEAFDKCSGAS